MRLLYSLLLGTVLLTSGCVAKTTVRHSADYSNSLQAQSSLTLLPAEVVVNTVNVTNQQERMYNYEYHLEDIITRELSAVFSSKGYHITPLKKADIHERKLSRAVVELRDQYNAARSSLYIPSLMEEKAAFSIHKKVGDKAVELGTQTKSAVFLLVDYSGSVKTNGARAKDLAMDLLIGTRNSSNVEGSTLAIGMVDAVTGDLLWSNVAMDQKDIYDSALDNLHSQDTVESKRINQLIGKVLAPLPAKVALGVAHLPK